MGAFYCRHSLNRPLTTPGNEVRVMVVTIGVGLTSTGAPAGWVAFGEILRVGRGTHVPGNFQRRHTSFWPIFLTDRAP
jgi:hypothetical protein